LLLDAAILLVETVLKRGQVKKRKSSNSYKSSLFSNFKPKKSTNFIHYHHIVEIAYKNEFVFGLFLLFLLCRKHLKVYTMS
jgi:hypothetical protein